jgi:hypothetical protein
MIAYNSRLGDTNGYRFDPNAEFSQTLSLLRSEHFLLKNYKSP